MPDRLDTGEIQAGNLGCAGNRVNETRRSTLSMTVKGGKEKGDEIAIPVKHSLGRSRYGRA